MCEKIDKFVGTERVTKLVNNKKYLAFLETETGNVYKVNGYQYETGEKSLTPACQRDGCVSASTHAVKIKSSIAGSEHLFSVGYLFFCGEHLEEQKENWKQSEFYGYEVMLARWVKPAGGFQIITPETTSPLFDDYEDMLEAYTELLGYTWKELIG